MKKLKFLIVIIMIIVLGIFLVRGNRLFKYDFGEVVSLKNFELMAQDSQGNVYGVYTMEEESVDEIPAKKYYIMKIGADKAVHVALLLETSNQKVMDIEIDESENIYVHYLNYHFDMLRVDSEEIIMYSPTGKEIKGIYKSKYEHEVEVEDPTDEIIIQSFMRLEAFIEYVQYVIKETWRYRSTEINDGMIDSALYEAGKIKNFEVIGSDIYIYREDDGQIIVDMFDENEGLKSEILQASIPSYKRVLDIIGHQLGSMWYTTADGSLYFVDETGKSLYTVIDDTVDYYTIKEIEGRGDNSNFYLEVENSEGDLSIYKYDNKSFEIVMENVESIYTKTVNGELRTFKNDLYFCMNNNQNLAVQENDVITEISTYDKKELKGSFPASKSLVIWQVFYINVLMLFIVLILLLLYMYYKTVLKNKLSVILKQSIFMLIIFTIFAIVMMYYIESMYSKQTDMMDGNIKEVFEEIIDDKLEEEGISKAFYHVQYLADLKVNELKKIENEDDVLKIYDDLIEKDIIDEIETLDEETLIKAVNEKYLLSVARVNEMPTGSARKLRRVHINEGSNFITLYHVTVSGETIDYANIIVNSDDTDRVVNHQEVVLTIGHEADQLSYINGDFVSGFSEDRKWLRSGKLVRYEDAYFVYRMGMNTEGYENVVITRNLVALDTTMKSLIIIAVVILLISIRLNLNNIKVLTKFVSGITEYDQAPSIDIKSKDEIGDLSNAFNDLLKDIKAKFLEQIKIYKVYSKYVPKEYETYLGKTILDLELGDFCEEEMTVMYFYVHEMFEVIESFGNQKHAFMFIKEYLDDISKVIRTHDGVVTKYDDGGITAIFEDNEQAIKASLDITGEIKRINETSKTKIKVGIGLNRGDLLLGVVGDESRMQLSVISKHSNIALDLAKRALGYSASILMTDEVKKKSTLKEHVRCLGYVLPLNSDQEMMVYDLYEGDPEKDFENKEATKSMFDEGIKLYQAGDFMKARYQFRKVIDVNHNDLVAQKYYFLADEYKLQSKNEIPHWSPILK